MAYASLVCLANTLDENLQLNLIPQNSQYIKALLQEVSFFQDFLEKSSNKSSETRKCLENRIRDIAYKAQDIVDSHFADLLDQSRSEICLQSSSGELEDYRISDYWTVRLFQTLDEVMKEINYIKQEAVQIEEKEKEEENNDEPNVQPRISLPVGSSRPPSHGVTKIVGLDDAFKDIKTLLGSGSLQCEIVALVGMGGIGKTTLAKKVYDDKSIVSHFDTRRWVTISQEYNIENIIEALLDFDQTSEENNENLELNLYKSGHDETSQKTNENLELDLYQSLKKRRYLIVLDDTWDTNVWDGLKRLLPNDQNGSRILLTTRLEKVAKHENSCPPKYVRLLNERESWALFCEKVFEIDCCPPELEKVGKEIVENCRGLPLAINVIGGHLSKAPTTENYWRSVAKNLCETIASEDDEHCSRVLSLSYKHLPHRLKGCFLYLGIFLEDYEIKVSVLLHLWIATGLIKQERSESFEDIAKEYFLNLVERNLILVSKLEYNGRIKRCKIHDLIRDLCVKEAKSDNFFHVTNRTLYYHGDCTEMDTAPYPRLLRASYLNMVDMGRFNRDFLSSLVNLRCLYNDQFHVFYHTHESIHKLQHLHTIYCLRSLNFNIWEMPQLRHVKIKAFLDFLTLHDPPTSKVEGGNLVIVLEKLQTLYTIGNLILSDEVLQRIPNIKKLGLLHSIERKDVEVIDWREFGLNNLGRLQKLESISCYFNGPPVVLSRDITFPPSIKRLTLKGSWIPWEQMTVVGLLPNLQVLKLEEKSFVGEEWEPIEGEFLNLKTLHLEFLDDLVRWRAMADHFPELQHLFINSCLRLREIPSGFGEIPTLQVIVLRRCKNWIVSSARQIEVEQHDFGNEGFQVYIR